MTAELAPVAGSTPSQEVPDALGRPAPAGRGGGGGLGPTVARRLGRLALRLYPFVLVVVVWHLLAANRVLGNEFVLPRPATVWGRAQGLWAAGELQRQTWATLKRVLAAFGLALVVGVALGTAIGRCRAARLAARPVVSFFFPTPKVALYPAMTIVFGLGSASKIAFGFAEAVFAVLLATAAATSRVEPQLLWSARAMGTSRAATVLKVLLPAALPGILTGARIGLVGALIGVFVGEMIVSADGLGNFMVIGSRRLRTADVYVAMATISVVGFALDRAFLALRARLLAWSPEG